MPLLGVVLLAAGGIVAPVEAQFGNGYSYRREFDVVDAKVIGGPHANFPVIVSDSLDELRTTANGGNVENANGYDIIFTSDEAGTNQLAHQIETYSPTTGKFDMWVRVESLATTSKIYMFYGNSSIGSFQGDVTSNGVVGVWDNDYQGVWHLNEATDATNVDATNNGNDGTPVGSPVSSAGQIGSALDFNVPGDATRIDLGVDPTLDVTVYTNFTMEAWVKPTSYGGGIKWPAAYGYGVDATLGLTVREAKNPPVQGAIEFWMNDKDHVHGNTAATFNDWNHIAVVYTPTTVYFYMNGQADGTAGAKAIAKSGLASYIGSDDIYPVEDDFLGLIDEVRFSGEIRSAGWIQTQFNNQSSPSTFFTTGAETFPPGATVNPDTTTASPLPSNGTNYTVEFTVVNDGGASDDYDLFTTQSPGTAISVVSITGTGVTQDADPDSARVASVAAGDSVVVTVTYSIADVAGGTTDTLLFRARSVTDTATADDGRLEVTVVRPNLITTKAVNPNGTQAPGTDLTYTVTFTNNGSEDAAAVVIVDSLAAEVEFKVGTVVNNLPGGIGVVVEYSNNDGGAWTYTPVSAGCGAPTGYDGCVTNIRWTLQNDLGSVAPDNTGNVEFIARIK
ncbi:MAG: DUF2341 domain-containing protein [Gemmatimonadota bacterium]|nr:MAG: DUF2341 domain-containing protein [Gemmatimonadota bacterium]